MNFSEFISFRKMITPTIIQILFWIGCGASVLGGLFLLFAGATSSFGGGFMVLQGLLMIVLGPIAVRIYCEILILFFKMYDAMLGIREDLARGQSSGAAAGK